MQRIRAQGISRESSDALLLFCLSCLYKSVKNLSVHLNGVSSSKPHPQKHLFLQLTERHRFFRGDDFHFFPYKRQLFTPLTLSVLFEVIGISLLRREFGLGMRGYK